MKQTLLSFCLLFIAVSCNDTNNVYKTTVLDYLQTKNGIKTDLKIKFQKFELSDITVGDSIKVLQERFYTEKQKKIDVAYQAVAHWNEAIAKQEKKGDALVAKALVVRYKKDLEKAEIELKQAMSWLADYVNRYADRSTSEVLAKKVDACFSFQNPKLATRQEISAYFILSPDGTKCYKMVF